MGFQREGIAFPMQAHWTVEGRVTQRAIASLAEGLELFEQVGTVAAAEPTMIEYAYRNGGRSFAIGAGRTLTVITFQASTDPPYFTSRGTVAREDDEVWFLYLGENTPYPGFSAVPTAEGIHALEYFLEFGERSDEIDWQQL